MRSLSPQARSFNYHLIYLRLLSKLHNGEKFVRGTDFTGELDEEDDAYGYVVDDWFGDYRGTMKSNLKHGYGKYFSTFHVKATRNRNTQTRLHLCG